MKREKKRKSFPAFILIPKVEEIPQNYPCTQSCIGNSTEQKFLLKGPDLTKLQQEI